MNGSALPNDFSIPDWEQGCGGRREEFGELLLLGRAFLSVDTISGAGRVVRGNRPKVGKYAVRSALRPTLLVPTKRGVSDVSARMLADVDLLIVNIQGLKGRRTIESIQNLLRARGAGRATLIIASSPCDILSLNLDTLIDQAARLPERFFARLLPTPVRAPRLIRVHGPLAAQLGLDPDLLAGEEGVEMLAGNRVAETADPTATAYAGHQFGTFVPQLGDGRAILLGELVDRAGVRRDVQLKGSGRTPYSRGGDGRAPLGPVLREYGSARRWVRTAPISPSRSVG